MPDEPDGTVKNGLRLESDSMGKVWVRADRLWGAGTERALVAHRVALSYYVIGSSCVLRILPAVN